MVLISMSISNRKHQDFAVEVEMGESILPKEQYKRKSRVLPFQHLVMRRLSLHPTTPLREVREDLQLIVDRHGEDVENIPVSVVDEIVAERGRMVDEVPMEEVDTREAEERGVETVEDEQGQGRQPTVPSIGSLSRFLRGVTGKVKVERSRSFPSKSVLFAALRQTRTRIR